LIRLMGKEISVYLWTEHCYDICPFL
jgi:hypothetical protein